jgi:adenosylcobyric acid synthase
MTHYTPIMIMGCTSDASKSSICTALCRHFANRGVRVAPFKAHVVSLLINLSITHK